MKREIPDDNPPRRPRRHCALSEEERALWDTVARSTKPLRTRSRKTVVVAATESSAPAVVQPPAQTAVKTPALKPQSKPSPAPPLALLQRRERSRIARGRREIDARLDLHGMTQARAHGALLRFLVRAQGDGLTLVLVITGKGTGKGTGERGEGRGVLRHQVPEWLALAEFRSLVVGFEEAHAAHGGSGALYVRVRRGR